MKRIGIFAFCFLLLNSVSAQESQKVVYKQIDSTILELEIFSPRDIEATVKYPAMIFFFGGGWKGGSTQQFIHHAKYFSSRGIICVLADYRVENRQHTTPFESLKDAKSAIRFLRVHSDQYQIDTGQIIASGGSAGGHLAAATALIKDYNETNEEQAVSCVPNALVLFNPVIDNGPGGYGYERIGDQYRIFSPLHNVTPGAPPTIIFMGTEDKLIPMETAKYYQVIMERVGSTCELHLFEDAGHGFFNYDNSEYYQHTVYAADRFLAGLGYLQGEPAIQTK